MNDPLLLPSSSSSSSSTCSWREEGVRRQGCKVMFWFLRIEGVGGAYPFTRVAMTREADPVHDGIHDCRSCFDRAQRQFHCQIGHPCFGIGGVYGTSRSRSQCGRASAPACDIMLPTSLSLPLGCRSVLCGESTSPLLNRLMSTPDSALPELGSELDILVEFLQDAPHATQLGRRIYGTSLSTSPPMQHPMGGELAPSRVPPLRMFCSGLKTDKVLRLSPVAFP